MVKFEDERMGHARRCDRLPDTHLALPREMGGAGSLTSSEQLLGAGDAARDHGRRDGGHCNERDRQFERQMSLIADHPGMN